MIVSSMLQGQVSEKDAETMHSVERCNLVAQTVLSSGPQEGPDQLYFLQELVTSITVKADTKYLAAKLGHCFGHRRSVYNVAWHSQPFSREGKAETENIRAAAFSDSVLVPAKPWGADGKAGAPGVSTEAIMLPMGLPGW
jgi:hypothetical protein